MPFVNAEHRLNPDENISGDRCFLHYKRMVERWKEAPRWTTADDIFMDVQSHSQPNEAQQRALELAWQVFFQEYVMEYERAKKKLNGDI